MLNKDIEIIINKIPESGHKVMLMYCWRKLLKKMNMPEPLIDNVEVMQNLAEFILSFFNALGFSVAIVASKNEEDPSATLGAVVTAINFFLPFLFNVMLKCKLSGSKSLSGAVVTLGAQTASIFAISSVFVHGGRLLSPVMTLDEQVKYSFIISAAALYAGNKSAMLTGELMMRAGQLIYNCRYNSYFDSLEKGNEDTPKLDKIISVIGDYKSTQELQFLIAIFVILIVSINEGAQNYIKNSPLSNPFLINSVLFPVTMICASAIKYFYEKILGK